MPVRFAISLEHRSILGKRNVNDKIAMPRHCDILQPWVLAAVAELVTMGVLEGLGKTVIEFPSLGGPISVQIFGLTPSGRDLVATHDIWKAEDFQ
jgi:hypothetical protein